MTDERLEEIRQIVVSEQDGQGFEGELLSEIDRLRELTRRQQGFIDKFQDWGYSGELSDAR